MTRRIPIGGPSMSPTLEIGDVALVESGSVRSGDVVVFETGESPICHRIVLTVPRPGGAWLVHRGDAEGARCGMTRRYALIGRVVAFERGGVRHRLETRGPRAGEVLAGLKHVVVSGLVKLARHASRSPRSRR